MRPSDRYFGPTLALLGAEVILGGIGVFLLAAPGTPWPIRGLGFYALALALWMGWALVHDLWDR